MFSGIWPMNLYILHNIVLTEQQSKMAAVELLKKFFFPKTCFGGHVLYPKIYIKNSHKNLGGSLKIFFFFFFISLLK